MKNYKLYGCLGILMLAASFTACSDDDDNDVNNGNETTTYVWGTDGGLKSCDHILFTNGKEDVNGTEIGNGDQEFVFKGTQTLKKGTYTLKGWVYIGDGAQLTIEPGTIIKGDKTTKASLIVERGGKLIAQGTASNPIVFTSAQAKGSRKPGDWGGIILCGKAQNNQTEMQIEGGPRTKHGGNDDTDNSGILSYVRIEFAGYPFQTDKEINGLTLGSVGSGTQIDHVQVSYSNDDSFEWFGGKVNCKYLIAYHGWDDDFDTDNGFSGNVQFGVSVRDSRIADASQSNGFESDNCADGSAVSPYTTCTFSNMTFIGPKADASFVNTNDYINGGTMNPNNGSSLGRFQSAMHIRRNSCLNCYNSVAVGWPIGLILDNQKGDTQGNAESGKLHLQNIVFANMDVTGTDANKCYDDVLVTGYDANSKPIYDTTQKSFSSTWFLAQSGNSVLASLDLSNWMPTAGSSLLSGASFDGLSSWFTQVSYIGAFAQGDSWLDGWTNFDPENTDY
ncbi:MAG: hypothetical protein ACOYJG_00785 [Prevotella sp.]|jgi:hypothetical protein